MVESIQERNGLWHVMLAEKDLVQQAGLDPDDFEQEFGYFKYKGRRVIVSHIYNQHLVVSMEGEEDTDLKQLMEAFSTVVEYKPFCKYKLLLEEGGEIPLTPTYEWDKGDFNERYDELSNKPTVVDLVRIDD